VQADRPDDCPPLYVVICCVDDALNDAEGRVLGEMWPELIACIFAAQLSCGDERASDDQLVQTCGLVSRFVVKLLRYSHWPLQACSNLMQML
jgi:hypothetical protein